MVRKSILKEFKVFDSEGDKTLEDTAQRALTQIQKKQYTQKLLDEEFEEGCIRKYDIAFRGKEVLIKEQKR